MQKSITHVLSLCRVNIVVKGYSCRIGSILSAISTLFVSVSPAYAQSVSATALVRLPSLPSIGLLESLPATNRSLHLSDYIILTIPTALISLQDGTKSTSVPLHFSSQGPDPLVLIAIHNLPRTEHPIDFAQLTRDPLLSLVRVPPPRLIRITVDRAAVSSFSAKSGSLNNINSNKIQLLFQPADSTSSPLGRYRDGSSLFSLGLRVSIVVGFVVLVRFVLPLIVDYWNLQRTYPFGMWHPNEDTEN